MVRTIISAVAALCLSCILLSCSFAPEDTPFSGRPAEFPDMRLENTQYMLGMEGEEPIRIQAATIELYEKADRAYITDASFVQYGEDDVETFTGSFGAAQVETDTNNLAMAKGVFIRNHVDRFTIEAESLYWEHEKRKAFSDDETLVTITFKDHDILRGTGFHGDFSSVTFEFTQVEEGRLHYD